MRVWTRHAGLYETWRSYRAASSIASSSFQIQHHPNANGACPCALPLFRKYTQLCNMRQRRNILNEAGRSAIGYAPTVLARLMARLDHVGTFSEPTIMGQVTLPPSAAHPCLKGKAQCGGEFGINPQQR
eukprot:3121238-Amphidinium_carterae.1